MSVYLLCKSGFSCDGNDGHEDESPGLPLFLWPVPRVPFVISPDYFLEMKTFSSYAFIILCVSVCLLNKTRHACKKAVYFSSDALS